MWDFFLLSLALKANVRGILAPKLRHWLTVAIKIVMNVLLLFHPGGNFNSPAFISFTAPHYVHSDPCRLTAVEEPFSLQSDASSAQHVTQLSKEILGIWIYNKCAHTTICVSNSQFQSEKVLTNVYINFIRPLLQPHISYYICGQPKKNCIHCLYFSSIWFHRTSGPWIDFCH